MTNEEAIRIIKEIHSATNTILMEELNSLGRERALLDDCKALTMAIEALERCSKICDTCARWKPFADAMECTRDHCERGYDDYCSKWEDRNSGI